MKISLLGYGRMGKEVEQVALERGHEIIYRIDNPESRAQLAHEISEGNAAIDFSIPEAAVPNIHTAFDAGVPIIVGTTGWYNELENVKKLCKEKIGSLLYAPNFSLGVNIFFAVNRFMARIMNNYSEYNVRVEEAHHLNKLDAPSGTAIKMANDLVAQLGGKNKWRDVMAGSDEKGAEDEIIVFSERIGDVRGLHKSIFTSEVDEVTLTHEAFSRKGFALGAVIAAEWLQQKKGVYTMEDVIQIN